jgi:hypothetical protein
VMNASEVQTRRHCPSKCAKEATSKNMHYTFLNLQSLQLRSYHDLDSTQNGHVVATDIHVLSALL